MPLTIELQPKQSELLREVIEGTHTRVMYGSANGGGKSHGIREVNLILCARNKQFPIKTLIFRRKSNDLLENHIIPFFTLHPQLEKFFNKTERMIYWPDGSTTKFGSSDIEGDITDYEGKEYDYIFIDEATHSTQYMIEYLMSRNRSPNYKAKMIFTTIPGGVGHAYLKRLFITKKYLEYENPDDYIYIPARVWDNVVWSERALTSKGYTVPQYYYEWTNEQRRDFTLNFSDYAHTLLHKSDSERKRRLYGDWDVVEGNFFDNWSHDVHVVKQQDYLLYSELLDFNIAGGLDYGNTTVSEWMARDFNGNLILFDELHQEKLPRSRKIEQQLEFQRFRGLSKTPIIADTNMWIKDAFDVDSTSMPANDYIAAGINLIPVSKSSTDKSKNYRENCNDNFKDVLDYKEEKGKIIQMPKLIVYERCAHFIETFPALLTDPNNPDDIADKQADHDFDAAKMVLMYLRQPVQKVDKEAYLRSLARPTASKFYHKILGGKLSDPTLKM